MKMHMVKTIVAVFIALYQVVYAVGLRDISPDGPCTPGELVFVGFCNLCLCNAQGMPNQLCARSWCRVLTPLPPRNSTSNTNKPLT